MPPPGSMPKLRDRPITLCFLWTRFMSSPLLDYLNCTTGGRYDRGAFGVLLQSQQQRGWDYMKCSFCRFKNAKGTHFCQRCRKALRGRRFLSSTQGGVIASMANPALGLATFVGMQIDQTSKSTVRRQRSVKVSPLKDGRWYCPDCGCLNRKFDIYCSGCGREFV